MPKIGELLMGEIIKIRKNKDGNDVGALVKLSTGEIAFLPVKEVSKNPKVYVKNIEDFVKIGEKIEVRFTGKNKKFNQLNVSLKPAMEEPSSEVVFQKKLERFMKDSRMKLSQIQKNTDRKQNGRKKKDPKKNTVKPDKD